MTPAAAAGLVLMWIGTLSHHESSRTSARICQITGVLLWVTWALRDIFGGHQ